MHPDIEARKYIYDPSLVLYLPLWKRDGLSIISDDAYGHLCTVTGALWTSQGRSFAGAEYIDCGNPEVLKLQNNFTVLAWARSTGAANQDVFSHAGETVSGWHLTLASATRVFTGDNFIAIINDINPGVNPLDGVWRLWGMDRAADNTTRLTMNGAVLDTDTYAGTFGMTGNFQLGRRSLAQGNWLTGGIGEVWVFNRGGMPEGEMVRLYQRTKWRYK